MDSETKQLMGKLQEPFLPDEIEWRVGSTTGDKTKGMALAYVTNRAIQNRLDELFGPFGWRNEFKEWKGNGQLCGISVKFGDEWITKWDGADDSNMEATKGGLSDAMKRAGYQWGIGRYLYKLDSTWEPIKQVGKSYALVSEPRLPSWALPEGFKYGASPKPPQQPPKLAEAPKAQQQAEPPKTEPSTPIDGPQLPTNTIRQLHAIRGKFGIDETEFKSRLSKFPLVGFEVNSLHDLAKLPKTELGRLIAVLGEAALKQVKTESVAGNDVPAEPMFEGDTGAVRQGA